MTPFTISVNNNKIYRLYIYVPENIRLEDTNMRDTEDLDFTRVDVPILS